MTKEDREFIAFCSLYAAKHSPEETLVLAKKIAAAYDGLTKKTKPAPVADINERVQRFKRECESYSNTYGISMVTDFFYYWAEMNKSRTKMRWELQQTWDIQRRMKVWANRSGVKPVTRRADTDGYEDFKENY